MELQGQHLTLTSVDVTSAERLLPIFNSDEQFNLLSGSSAKMTLEMVQADISDGLTMPGGTLWQISVSSDPESTPIGVAQTACIPPPSSAWIALLLIQPTDQQRGYGREAADLLEHYFFSNEAIKHIGLGVLVKNQRAIRFWHNRGYTQGLQRHDSYGNEMMTMRLDKSTVASE